MPRPFDATVLAQKALSAVARLNQQVSQEYIIDFLTGSKSEKILPEHRLLKTFGIGAGLSRQEWLNHLRDFISLGYLARKSADDSTLLITPKGWRVLKGQEQVWLEKSARGNKISKKGVRIPDAPEHEPDLLGHLKDVRKYLASKYEIETDEVVPFLRLHQMAVWLPDNPDDLQQIAGWNDSQLKSYGSAFLQLIREYLEVNGLQSRMNLKRSR